MVWVGIALELGKKPPEAKKIEVRQTSVLDNANCMELLRACYAQKRLEKVKPL